MDQDYHTESELRRLQIDCTKILEKFKSVCDEYNLRYYLAYGTLLGAIRHKGNIPWDDDIDVWMPRSDFEQLLRRRNSLAPYVLDYHFLDNPHNKWRTTPCIINPEIKVGLDIDGKIHTTNLWIDVIPMDGLPTNELMRRIHLSRFKMYYIMISFARSSITGAFRTDSQSKIKRLGIKLNDATKIGKLINIQKTFVRFLKTKKMYSFDESEYVHGSTYAFVERSVMKREWFEGNRTMEFEGDYYRVPQQTEKVLETLYGDYMTPPPVNKRVNSHIKYLSSKIDDGEDTRR